MPSRRKAGFPQRFLDRPKQPRVLELRRRQVYRGAARHIVDHDGAVRRVGDGGDVAEHALRRRFVVVRPDDEEGVGPGVGGLLREADALRRVVRARPDHDRHAPGGVPDGDLDDPAAFLGRDGGVLARRAQNHERFDAVVVRAAVDLEVDQSTERGVIDAVIGGEGGDERGRGAAENGLFHGAKG